MAYSDTFIIGADFQWAKIGVDGTFKVDGSGPFANLRAGSTASVTQEFAFATAYAGYRIPLGSPNLNLYGTIGLRYNYLSASVNITRDFPVVLPPQPAGFTLSSQQTEDWVDPTIGLAMRYRIDDKWYIAGYGDIGGFGVGSKISSEDFVSVGYNWSRSISTELGFKVLYTDYQRNNSNGGSFRYDTTLWGPLATLSFNF